MCSCCTPGHLCSLRTTEDGAKADDWKLTARILRLRVELFNRLEEMLHYGAGNSSTGQDDIPHDLQTTAQIHAYTAKVYPLPIAYQTFENIPDDVLAG
eukprot:jgi/Tetstr1/455523/TSEL_042347.t1